MMMYLKLFSTKLRPGVGDDARVCPYKEVLTGASSIWVIFSFFGPLLAITLINSKDWLRSPSQKSSAN